MLSDFVPALERQADIDTGYDARFEATWWMIERAVWCLFAFVIAIALLGLLGRGPLNKKMITHPDGTVVRYERVIRYHTPTLIHVQLPVSNSSAELLLDKTAVEKLGLKQILPLPSKNLSSAQAGPFLFEAPVGTPSVFVQLSLEPASIGPIRSTLHIDAQTDITLHQFAVP